jgi:hypothetical protein
MTSRMNTIDRPTDSTRHTPSLRHEKARSNERASLLIDPATSYFPTIENCSIIGSSRLNFRVRDGNGCDPTDKITGKLFASINALQTEPTLEFSTLISEN